MCRTLPPLMLASLFAAGWASGINAQEILPTPPQNIEAAPRMPPPPVGFGPAVRLYAAPPYAVPLYAPPFSRDARLRDQQAVARQLGVLDWTRWQANAWPMHGPDELWLFGQPLTFAWDFPPVEQPIGYQRTYDGRGGYSSGPVYADQISPAPPRPHLPPVIRGPVPEAEPEVAARRSPHSAVREAASRKPDTPRRLFSW